LHPVPKNMHLSSVNHFGPACVKWSVVFAD
jgi:hypothetical protein